MTVPASAAGRPEAAGGPSLPPDRSRAVVELLHAVAASIVREPDRRELARTLARECRHAMRAESCVVAMVEDDAVRAHVLQEGTTPNEGPLEGSTVALLEWAAQRRQSWHGNIPNEAVPGLGITLGGLGWRSAAVVPVLHHQGHANAVFLVVNRVGAGGFSPLDVRILETVAQQAAVAFDRGLLLDQLEEWTRGMEALLAFSASVNRQRDPAELVDEMVEHTARFLKADGGRAGLVAVDAATGAASFVSTRRWLDGRWIEEARSWGASGPLPGALLEIQFPMLVQDYATDRLADPTLREHGVVGSLICVPMKDPKGEILGFLELHRRPGRAPLTWHDIGFVESLTNTTAVSIENARLVRALAAKTEEIRALAAHHVTSLESERQHIARELHDEAGQALVGVKLSLQALAAALPSADPGLRDALDEVRLQVNDATSRLRDLARHLRPPTLDQLGLDSALRQLAHDVESRSGMQVVVQTDAMAGRLPTAVETAFYRIAQEALTNVARHSQAARVDVHVAHCDGRMWLRVADDGIGFQVDAVTSGLGLLGIRERVAMLAGHTRVVSAPGQGTQLVVEVPLA